ncbi:hypothetical protein V6N11_051065 [Hibiscus sabdariffa]|uniref:Reverse transcriptase zinc-binding domain-containing protein n=1 Tax=Hibiscus sabdariffa TaxID=183260 RepID=A0ABR2R3A4_9ROSI
MIHILRDCPTAHSVWHRMLQARMHTSFFQGDLTSWIHSNLGLSAMDNDAQWALESIEDMRLLSVAWASHFHTSNRQQQCLNKKEAVSWSPPRTGWFTLTRMDLYPILQG